MILVAAFSRIIPHMTNFSPLAAISLFGAAHFEKKWQAFLIPIAATWLSDLFISNVLYAQNYTSFTWFYQGFYWQYASYLLIVLAAIFIFKKVTITSIVSGIVASTVIFFLVSNFGVWMGSRLYPKSFSGLLACYAAAVPYLQGTLLGNLFYSGALFGGFYLVKKKVPALGLQHRQLL
jgi:hypothetical protein